ncbi:MAG: polysaccharide biosynthesis C-terminal domain-containing protein [Candidatus Aenigmatarchaeota archaeon]
MSNSTKKVVANGFYIFLMWGFSTLFGYFFWVVLANFLPKADVGIFSAILNLALLATGLSFLGMHTAETKLLPQYAAKKENSKIGGTIRYVTKTVMILNLAAAVLIFLFAPQLSAFYLNENALRILAILLVVLSLATITANHLYSMQKMKLFFLTESAAAFGKLALAALLIIFGFGWLGAAGGVAFSFLAIALFRLKQLPFRGTADRKEVWHYAVPAFFAGIGTILVNQGSIVFLSFLANAAAVGTFTIAFMFTTPIKIVPQIISQAIFPVTSEKYAENDSARLRNLVTQSMRYCYLIAAPLTIAFVLFARQFLLLFAGSYISAAAAFQILAAAYFFFGLGTIITGVLYYVGKPNLNRNITLFSGVANIALLFALVPFFGIEGAAAAFLVSGGILFFAGTWYARKHIKIPIGKNNLAKIALSSVVFAAVLLLSRIADFSGTAEAAWIIVSLAFASAAYLFSLLLLRFFSDVDVRIMEGVESKVPKIFKPAFAVILSAIKKYSSDKK